MMLKARLDALRRAGGATVAGAQTVGAPTAEPTPALQDRLQRMQLRAAPPAPRTDAAGLARALGGKLSPEGVVVVERRCSLADITIDAHSASWPLGEAVEPARLCFFDTETNGLAGGTGTIAFMIGAARLDGQDLHVRQYLLSCYAAEAAMLREFYLAVDRDAVLVSYNGKRFDAPLLATRCRLHGRPDGLADRAHADLLYPVRRLFARRWPDCRMLTAEQKLLGLQRAGDLPGSEAPWAWSAWLRRGDAAALRGVVEHNLQDLVSLARLWFVLQQVYARPAAYDLDLQACAKVYQQHAGTDQAYRLLRENRARLDADGLRMLAAAHRRAGDWSAALKIWQMLAPGGCQVSIAALAKYHEHRGADPRAALGFAEQLQDPVDKAKRLQRLRGKIGSDYRLAVGA